LVILVPLKTRINAIKAVTDCNFNLIMSPLYQIKLKITKTADRLLQCVLQNVLFQTFTEGRSMLENSFDGLLAENVLHSHGFSSKNYLQTQYG